MRSLRCPRQLFLLTGQSMMATMHSESSDGSSQWLWCHRPESNEFPLLQPLWRSTICYFTTIVTSWRSTSVTLGELLLDNWSQYAILKNQNDLNWYETRARTVWCIVQGLILTLWYSAQRFFHINVTRVEIPYYFTDIDIPNFHLSVV